MNAQSPDPFAPLIAEYTEYLAANTLPAMCAMELLHAGQGDEPTIELTREQIIWLSFFCIRWDELDDQLAGRN
jgi:hypothetical protein